MESNGAPGRVCTSPAVHAALCDEFEFESREAKTVKGQGLMVTYFLVREKDAEAREQRLSVVPRASLPSGPSHLGNMLFGHVIAQDEGRRGFLTPLAGSLASLVPSGGGHHRDPLGTHVLCVD
eukprot:Opistho-2@24148